MSDADPIYRPGRMIAGRYRILSALSQGGMGAVYLAQQVSLGREVALKVILERGSDPELIKRFDVEARAVCQLKHPNIITYHDYGRDDDGLPFLVMEYLAGYPGTKLVYGERRPSLLDLVHVVAQVCSALHEAHAKGIIHRDLKWSNVMICPQSHDPYFAKLIDFGIMKVATDGSSGDQRALTRTGMLLGTPEYMSPEAICGMPIDGRADQYSLAVMLWEALEGHRPFDGASHFELLRQQVQDQPPPFEVAAPLVTTYPQVEAAILQALEKHPDDRFETIIDFQQALMQATGLAGMSVTSPSRPRARGAPVTRSLQGERRGMPSSKTRLPAVALEGPRPLDTAHKTGQQRADEAPPRRLHWAVLALGFLIFLGLGFGTMMALMGPKDDASTALVATEAPDAGPLDSAALEEIQLAAAPDMAPTMPDTSPAPEVAVAAAPDTSPAPIADTASPPETALAAAIVPVAAEVVSPVVAVAAPEKAKAQAPGRLWLQVDPWGNLAIDGRSVGRAPFDGELKPGSHTVTVTNTYFKGSYSFRIRVESGRRVARTVVLEQHLERVE